MSRKESKGHRVEKLHVKRRDCVHVELDGDELVYRVGC